MDAAQGDECWIDHVCQAVYASDGRNLGRRASNRSVTEKMLLSQSLQLERQRLKGIIDATHTGTWEWNVQTGETWFNQRWAQICGYALEELAPHQYPDLALLDPSR